MSKSVFLSGMSWKAIEQVSDQLARRGWSMYETESSLEELRDRGWKDGFENLSISKLGKQIRDESEVLKKNLTLFTMERSSRP